VTLQPTHKIIQEFFSLVKKHYSSTHQSLGGLVAYMRLVCQCSPSWKNTQYPRYCCSISLHALSGKNLLAVL